MRTLGCLLNEDTNWADQAVDCGWSKSDPQPDGAGAALRKAGLDAECRVDNAVKGQSSLDRRKTRCTRVINRRNRQS